MDINLDAYSRSCHVMILFTADEVEELKRRGPGKGFIKGDFKDF